MIHFGNRNYTQRDTCPIDCRSRFFRFNADPRLLLFLGVGVARDILLLREEKLSRVFYRFGSAKKLSGR